MRNNHISMQPTNLTPKLEAIISGFRSLGNYNDSHEGQIQFDNVHREQRRIQDRERKAEGLKNRHNAHRAAQGHDWQCKDNDNK